MRRASVISWLMVSALFAFASAGERPVPLPATATAVTIHCADGSRREDVLVPGEWVEGCLYRGGKELRLGRKGPRALVSIDGRASRLAAVYVSEAGGLEALRQSLAEGVTPLTVHCDSDALDKIPAVPREIVVALRTSGSNLPALERFLGRCPGLEALWFSSSSELPIPITQFLVGLRKLRSLRISLWAAQPGVDPPGSLEDLTPLGQLTNLRVLSLAGPLRASDFAPLGKLTQLTSLAITVQKPMLFSSAFHNLELPGLVADLRCLRRLTALRKLSLHNVKHKGPVLPELAGLTEISQLDLFVYRDEPDIAPIANLRRLRKLWLYGNGNQEVSDLSPLAGLKGLREFSFLAFSKAPDLAPLAALGDLRSLSIYCRSGSPDLTPLAGLANLTRLSVFPREARTVESLPKCVHVRRLDLNGFGGCEVVPSLARLTKLTELSISSAGTLRDLRGIADLPALERLTLSWLDTLPALPRMEGMTALRRLHIEACPKLKDLSGMGSPPHLTELVLVKCGSLRDLTPLRRLSGLKSLSIQACEGVADLSPLANLRQLDSLDLSYCPKVVDFSPLGTLSHLRSLSLFCCPKLADLLPLAKLSSLATLKLTSCMQLADLKPLAELPQLSEVYLVNCPAVRDLRPLRQMLKRGGAVTGWLGPALRQQVERLRTETDF